LILAHSVIFASSLQLTAPLVHVPQGGTQATQQTLESLWWKQEANVTGFVALTNPGSEASRANLVVLDSQGNPLSQSSVTVSPHGTQIIDLAALPQTAGASGGLRVQYIGQPNDLIVLGGLRDDAIGYSASIGFAPMSSAGTQTSAASYAALGLMAGAADPMLSFPKGTTFDPYTVARNISGQPILITPSLWWMAGGAAKIAALPQFTLAPGQSKNLDFSSLLALAGLRNYNGTVNLVLDVPAGSPKGALLLSSGSVDQKNTYVFQVVPQGIKESIAKNLSYWSTANRDDTMVTLWNPADEAQDFVFTLFYTGGHYLYPIHLEPRATHMFNISEILQSALPDAEGNVIPAGIHEGSAELSGSQGEAEHILVAMDAGTYNVQKATCNNFCKTCQGATDSWITDNPFAVAVSGTHQLTMTVQNHSGTQVNDTSVASWSSSNASVATVSTGLVNGVAAGSLTADSFDGSFPLYSSGCYSYSIECPLNQGTSASAPGNAIPVITSISPSLLNAGDNKKTLTINGKGFGSSPTVNLPSGVSRDSTNQQTASDTQIQLSAVNVAASAYIGPNNISVTSGGLPSAPSPFTIDGPDHMVVTADALGKCSGCSTTVRRTVTLQVIKFTGSAAYVIPIGEVPSVSGWNCAQQFPGTTSTPCSQGVDTDTSGSFQDSWSMSSDAYTPVGCGYSITTHWQWCAAPKTFGTLSGYTHTNAINMNGVVSPPYRFPIGTVIYP
jgi:hypothetical protein